MPIKLSEFEFDILTSDYHISGNRHTVHLGLNGARIFPSMPQLDVPDHDVTSRALSVQRGMKKKTVKCQNFEVAK